MSMDIFDLSQTLKGPILYKYYPFNFMCEDNFYYIMTTDIFDLRHLRGSILYKCNFMWGQLLPHNVHGRHSCPQTLRGQFYTNIDHLNFVFDHGHFWPQTLKKSILYILISCEDNYYHIMSMDILDLKHWRGQFI